MFIYTTENVYIPVKLNAGNSLLALDPYNLAIFSSSSFNAFCDSADISIKPDLEALLKKNLKIY